VEYGSAPGDNIITGSRAGSPASPASPPLPGRRQGGAAAILRIAGRVAAAAFALAFLYALIRVARLGVIPLWWLAGGSIIAVAAVAALAVGLWRTRPNKHPYRFTVLASANVLGVVVSLIAASLASAVGNFVTTIQPTPDGAMSYDVIALTSHADGIESTAGQTVGQVATDPNKAIVAERLAQVVAVDLVELADPGLLADTLLNGTVKAAVIDRAYLPLLEENSPGFSMLTKVLYTLDITLPQPSASPSPSELPQHPDNGAFLAYISGIDQFGSIGSKGRSDVNILMAVNPETGRILLVSTPRDFYVQLHGTTGLKDKLTHSGVYGIGMSQETLEDLYGVDIDYYLKINFSSVIQVVDLVGGVDVNSDQAFISAYGGYAFKEGWNHLNGDQALGFARERYSFASGDRARGENQEKVVAALIRKMAEPSVLLRYGAILEAAQNGIETSMPPDQIAALANQQLSRGTDWQIDSISVNGSDASEPTYSYGSQRLYVMIPDMATVETATARLNEVLGR
jgi:LCP family protein required for cell wall assembly